MESKEVFTVKEPVSLEQYQRAEEKIAAVEGRRGLIVHAWISVAVVTGLVVVNVLVASEFPWSIFPAVGMAIGVAFHWFGIRHLPRDLATRQDEIEREATRLTA